MTALTAATLSTSATAAGPNPEEMVNALNGVFGRHVGARGSHAKGFCAQAQFIPSEQSRTFVKSSLFAQSTVPATVRFSVGGGNPNVSDKSRTVRGLAVRLEGQSEMYDLVLISEPVFFAATPESFVSFLQARVPDATTKKPDPEKVKAHNERFPDGTRQPALLASHAAPASYASTPYFSNHAFKFVGSSNQGVWARVVVEPTDGTHYLSADAEATLPDLFLENEMQTRLAKSPAEFTVYAQLAEPGDSLTDPSQPWAAGAAKVNKVALGKLRIESVKPAASCDGMMFLPTQLPEGIEPADDPILHSRAAAYGVSLGRRMSK